MNREELLKNAKPILFNTEMVQAILEGRKTVTRRVIKNVNSIYRPFEIGDILYVRETWQKNYCNDIMVPGKYAYKASPETWQYFNEEEKILRKKWKPSIHMPKEAARIFLKVTDVRVEKLHDITKEQARKEGCDGRVSAPHDGAFSDWQKESDFSVEKFQSVWDSTIKKQDFDKYSWEANPWVWVIEFERVEVENE